LVDLGHAETLARLIEACRTAEREFENSQLWFRGHCDGDWPLVPTAHRRAPILEAQCLNHFRLRAPGLRDNCPAHDDFAAWLPLMRHYGLPTRLLDWTESVSVAAFFATRPDTDDSIPAAIWMLSPGHLNRVTVGNFIPFLTHQAISSVVESAFWPDILRFMALVSHLRFVKIRTVSWRGYKYQRMQRDGLEKTFRCLE
jgi:FRG domain-containing protein